MEQSGSFFIGFPMVLRQAGSVAAAPVVFLLSGPFFIDFPMVWGLGVDMAGSCFDLGAGNACLASVFPIV